MRFDLSSGFPALTHPAEPGGGAAPGSDAEARKVLDAIVPIFPDDGSR
jgi:hypothetical protein